MGAPSDKAAIMGLGQVGSKAITGTDAVTPATGYYFFAIQFTSDAVVAAQGNVTGAVNVTMSSLSAGIPAGTIVFGKFNSITLTSGQAIGYYAV